MSATVGAAVAVATMLAQPRPPEPASRKRMAKRYRATIEQARADGNIPLVDCYERMLADLLIPTRDLRETP